MLLPGVVSYSTSVRNGLPSETLSSTCQNCADLLDFYRSRANGTCAGPGGAGGGGFTGFAAVQAPAVITQTSYERAGPFIYRRITQNGTIMNISVEVSPGGGRTLVQTRPLMGVVFQDAANTAVQVAGNRTGFSFSESDVIFSIDARSMIPAVDGPSAGALMTILVEAAVREAVPAGSVTLTGTIDPYGNIGAIGGVVDKARAAKDAGKEVFLMPGGNRDLSTVTRNVVRIGGVDVTEQVPQVVDARQYIEQNVGIRAEYVDTIGDAERYFFP